MEVNVSMASKENQRIVVTKRMLKEGLLRLMENKCLQKISVSELCQEAGINRATFYNHYTAPADILREIGDELADEINELLREKKRHHNVSIQERVEFACEYLLQNKRTAKLLFQNNTPESEFAVKLIRGQDDWQLLNEKLNSVYGKKGTELLFTFLIHGAYCMITKWLLEDMDMTPKEMGTLFNDICTSGVPIRNYLL